MSIEFEPMHIEHLPGEDIVPVEGQVPDLESLSDSALLQFGDTAVQGAVGDASVITPVEQEPVVHKRKAGKHKGTVPPKSAPKPSKQGRGHPMKQTKAHLSQQGKLNAQKPMSPEQRKLRRKKRRR